MLNADKEENPHKETPLDQGFPKASCKGEILVAACIPAVVEFTLVPATPWLSLEAQSHVNADHHKF